MITRSLLIIAPVIALAALSACATGPSEGNTKSTSQALCTIDAFCDSPSGGIVTEDPKFPTRGPAAPYDDPPPDTVEKPIQCTCDYTGPNGYGLALRNEGDEKNENWVCLEMDKCCPPGVNCPPSSYVSVYNPCGTGFLRCNAAYCWCSPY